MTETRKNLFERLFKKKIRMSGFLRRHCGQNANCAKQNEKKHPAAATKYQWKKDRQNSAAGVGFMRARQPDASAHDRPNPGDEPTTQRYDLQWPSGAMR